MFSFCEAIGQINERKTHDAPGLKSESSRCAASNPEGVVFLSRCHIIRPCDQVNETGNNFSCLLPPRRRTDRERGASKTDELLIVKVRIKSLFIIPHSSEVVLFLFLKCLLSGCHIFQLMSL